MIKARQDTRPPNFERKLSEDAHIAFLERMYTSGFDLDGRAQYDKQDEEASGSRAFGSACRDVTAPPNPPGILEALLITRQPKRTVCDTGLSDVWFQQE